MTAPITRRASVCALVPHYRCEQWLDQALESLLEQTRPLDAIVVIDDGSGDPPADTVARHPEVTLLAADDNGGPYRLVQAVIDATDFDAYLFQDADDWSAPDRLEVLLDTAVASGAELVGSHEVRVLVEEGDVVTVEYPLDVNAALAERPAGFPLLHPTSLVSGSLVRRLGGFATGMRFSGDAEFLRRAGHAARVVNADHFGYYRRKRRGSLTLGSDTALGSPARLAVQETLAMRARANAARAEAGEPLDLAPWKTAPAPNLHRLCGPVLGERRRGAAPARPAPTSEGAVFVIGAPHAGHNLLAWGLGQHPSFGLLADSRWLARSAGDITARACEEAAPTPADFPELLGAALRQAAGGDRRRILASGTELLRSAHALDALFPGARFIHVVRDCDGATSANGAAPTTGGEYLGPEAVWRAWLAASELGLLVECALGSDRVLRVRWAELADDPEQTVRRCLAFLGEEEHVAACTRPLQELTSYVNQGEPAAPPELVARARALSASLGGPQPAAAGPGAREELADRFRQDRIAAVGDAQTHVERVRALVCSSVPEGSTLAVISRGDPRLVDLPGRAACHLPQSEGGVYAGHHPADSHAATDQLERARSEGAEYLVVPATSSWWLTYYEGLAHHLEETATLVSFLADVGAVYRLAVVPPVVTDGEPPPPTFVARPPDALSRVQPA